MAMVEARATRASRDAPARPSGYHSRYRPDIEGLRAVAVLTVVAFHASVPFLRGGFVGVDVFFVISGYLITGLMLTEIADSGGVSLRLFYARRARRILPGAAVALTCTVIASWFVVPLLRVRDVAQDVVASALYLANWRFIAQGTDYLAASADPSPVLHYWSLAVEEQFYLVWPPLVLGVVLVTRRRGRSPFRSIGRLLLLLTLASFALSLVWTRTSAPLAYMSTASRAWQFGAGALLALAGPALARRSSGSGWPVLGGALGWTGLVAVVGSAVAITSSVAYPGTLALAPTLGTVAIIAGGIISGHAGLSVGRVLSLGPVRALGRLSYAWYLWHWPVLVLAEARIGVPSWPVQAALVAASALPAWLSMKLVERPIRFSAVISRRPSSGIAIGLAATLVALTVGLGAGDRAVQSLTSVDAAGRTPTLTSVFGTVTSSVHEGAVSPSPLSAKADRPQPDSCILQSHEVTSPPCRFGAASGPLVVLFGDSHAQEWQPALQDLAKQRGWVLQVITKAGCPVPRIAPRNDGSNFSMPECATWREKSIQAITRQLHPALIVVSSLNHYIPDQGETLTAWNESLDRLRTAGAPIFYIADTPWPNKDIPVCMSSSLGDWSHCSFARDAALRTDPVEQEVLRGLEAHVTVADFTNYLCPTPRCPAAEAGTLFYRDDSHITATLARVLEPALATFLDQAGLLSPVSKSAAAGSG